MIGKVNFDAVIQHLHEYAEGGYINIHDIHIAVEAVTGRKIQDKDTETVLNILVDLRLISSSEIDPSNDATSVLKYRLL